MKNKILCLLILCTIISLSTTLFPVKGEEAKISITPENQTIPEPGLSFTINITIENVIDLYAWELKLYYPNDILNGSQVTEGPMLKTGGKLSFFYIALFTDNYNETHGIVNALCTRVESDVPGVNGDGVLATITFKTKSASSSKTLHLEDVKLSDSHINPIPFTTTDGTFTVIPEFPAIYILPALILSALAAFLGKILLQKNKRNTT